MANAVRQITNQGGTDVNNGSQTQTQTGNSISVQDAVENVTVQSGGPSTTTSTQRPSQQTQTQRSGPQVQRTREDAAFTLSVSIPLEGGVPSDPISIS